MSEAGQRTRLGAAAPSSQPVQPPTLDLVPGAKLKQFELIRELGRGGMGQVFLARDTRLARLVALKFLDHASDEMARRFLVEARATARCHHENIVLVYEADEYRGKPYIVLEYLEGEPLAKTIADKTLPPSRVVELLVPVVRALARAHEHSIVHCDLKPDNILITKDGTVKVLDFGIARAVAAGSDLAGEHRGIAGTVPYMAPEQWGFDEIDHRTDLWAIGIILWEMLTGRHPLQPVSTERVMCAAAELDQPMPGIAEVMPECPPELEQIVERCLIKRKAGRYASARDLLDVLEPLLPRRFGRRLDEDENPYPGMSAFQESDAGRFFGRGRDITTMIARMSDVPLLGVVAPSGVGKSSFVRAGVIPALRASGETWEVLVMRPGRNPLGSLATLLQPMTRTTGHPDLGQTLVDHQQLVSRLGSEPGYLGSLLRSRAGQKRERILLFVDQFEELYTQCDQIEQRRAFTACLSGVADDAGAPLRVVLSMRADFLHRAAEDRAFMDQLTKGIQFLRPMDADGMREALEEPLAMAGYSFENPFIVDAMLEALEGTAGALPLLQFTAARMWESRDRGARFLTEESYRAMGGIGGALATHADQVIGALSPERQKLARTLMLRLVTPEATREVVELEELMKLADPKEVTTLVDALVAARLLAVQGRDRGPVVEIVHESLIVKWPMLRRWIEESSEDSAFLDQLRNAAKQWEARGRVAGLLWRGEALEDARTFARRFKGELPSRERDFLDAVLAEATRSLRRRRRLVVSAFVFLALLVAAAAVALLWIRQAQQEAERQQATAEREAKRARADEVTSAQQLATIKEQLHQIREAEAARQTAEKQKAEVEAQKAQAEQSLSVAQTDVEQSREQLEAANKELKLALARATTDRNHAEEATKHAKAAADKLNEALERERARVKELEAEAHKMVHKL